MPPTADDFYAGLRRFRLRRGIPVGRLAQVFGVGPTSLTASHLARRDAIKRLADQFHRRLGRITADLQLGERGFLELQALASMAQQIAYSPILGVAEDVDLGTAMDRGEAGEELFALGAWREGEEHLAYSWPILQAAAPANALLCFFRTMRVGTQLAGLYNYRGRHGEASTVVRNLLSIARSRSVSEAGPTLVRAVAHVYKGAAIAMHHQGLSSPRAITQHARRCREMLATNGEPDIHGQVACLRDEARPLLIQHFGLFRPEAPDPRAAETALQGLCRAEALAEARWGHPQMPMEWTLTRLERVECLGALERGDEALRLYEDTLQRPEMDALLQEGGAPLYGKLRTAGIAARWGLGSTGRAQAAEDAAGFLADAATAELLDRRWRLSQFVRGYDHPRRARMALLSWTERGCDAENDS